MKIIYFSKNLVGCSNCFGCTNLRNKQNCIFNVEYTKEEYNKKLDEAKAKEAQESLKSNDKDDKAKSGNISFEDYWSLKKQQQTLDNAELKKLQEELGKKSLTYSDNLSNKYGVDKRIERYWN